MADPSLELAEPVCVGPQRRIFAYRAANGRVPALEFLSGLDATARGRYVLRFRQMADNGAVPGKFWHPWDAHRNKNAKGLGSFKDNQSQTRIPTFSDATERGVMILTHGFGGKKEDQIDDSEVNEAARIKRDYEERRAADKGQATVRGGGPKGKRK